MNPFGVDCARKMLVEVSMENIVLDLCKNISYGCWCTYGWIPFNKEKIEETCYAIF